MPHAILLSSLLHGPPTQLVLSDRQGAIIAKASKRLCKCWKVSGSCLSCCKCAVLLLSHSCVRCEMTGRGSCRAEAYGLMWHNGKLSSRARPGAPFVVAADDVDADDESTATCLAASCSTTSTEAIATLNNPRLHRSRPRLSAGSLLFFLVNKRLMVSFSV